MLLVYCMKCMLYTALAVEEYEGAVMVVFSRTCVYPVSMRHEITT